MLWIQSFCTNYVNKFVRFNHDAISAEDGLRAVLFCGLGWLELARIKSGVIGIHVLGSALGFIVFYGFDEIAKGFLFSVDGIPEFCQTRAEVPHQTEG